MTKAMWFAIVAAVVTFGAGVREWEYHQGHRFRPGPSGSIAAIGLAVGVLAVVVAYIAHELAARDR